MAHKTRLNSKSIQKLKSKVKPKVKPKSNQNTNFNNIEKELGFKNLKTKRITLEPLNPENNADDLHTCKTLIPFLNHVCSPTIQVYWWVVTGSIRNKDMTTNTSIESAKAEYELNKQVLTT